MNRVLKKNSSFKAGMFLLENLTSGMYNEPLSVYREYIQNAVDSIDLISHKRRRSLMKVNIIVDPLDRRITIRDNGAGIPADIAQEVLSSIGSSDKTGKGLRGFRGIGRLGGIAFSDKVVFRTKAKGEKVESIQEWDGKKLRTLLSDPRKTSLTLRDLFYRLTTFSQKNTKQAKGSYFEVTLREVSSFRNYIFDIERIRHYLSQVAPVPFNPAEFSYCGEIDAYLSANLSQYGRYDITLNGEAIYKPYGDFVKITKGGTDYIDSVKFFEIKLDEDVAVGYGWYGERRDLLGSIRKGEACSGIRVRVGNILLGDAHLIDSCFREQRFNSYVIGEVHVNSPLLIPNSRRDNFVDNESKTRFYNAIEREIGLPISKEIRVRSRLSSKALSGSLAPEKKRESDAKLIGSSKKDGNKEMGGDVTYTFDHTSATGVLNEMLKSCKECPNLRAILSKFPKL